MQHVRLARCVGRQLRQVSADLLKCCLPQLTPPEPVNQGPVHRLGRQRKARPMPLPQASPEWWEPPVNVVAQWSLANSGARRLLHLLAIRCRQLPRSAGCGISPSTSQRTGNIVRKRLTKRRMGLDEPGDVSEILDCLARPPLGCSPRFDFARQRIFE
jgi:hypothetical protein